MAETVREGPARFGPVQSGYTQRVLAELMAGVQGIVQRAEVEGSGDDAPWGRVGAGHLQHDAARLGRLPLGPADAAKGHDNQRAQQIQTAPQVSHPVSNPFGCGNVAKASDQENGRSVYAVTGADKP